MKTLDENKEYRTPAESYPQSEIWVPTKQEFTEVRSCQQEDILDTENKFPRN